MLKKICIGATLGIFAIGIMVMPKVDTYGDGEITTTPVVSESISETIVETTTEALTEGRNAKKIVTASDKKNIKKALKNIEHYIGINEVYNIKKHKKKTVKMSKENQLIVTAASYKGNKMSIKKSSFNKRGKEIFGTSIKTNSLKKYKVRRGAPNFSADFNKANGWALKKGSKVYLALGDWGDAKPVLKITKITNKGNNIYVANITVKWSGTLKSKIGTAKITFKKTSKAKYKFAITKIYMKRK